MIVIMLCDGFIFWIFTVFGEDELILTIFSNGLKLPTSMAISMPLHFDDYGFSFSIPTYLWFLLPYDVAKVSSKGCI